MSPHLVIGGLAFLASAALSFLLVLFLLPGLRRYAVARPNQRSSHRKPTPQGGGLAVIAATLVIAAFFLRPTAEDSSSQIFFVFAAIMIMAIVGAVDDLKTLEVAPRLLFQLFCVALVVVYALPSDLRILPIIPPLLERTLIIFCGLWFVNLVNFMDGIDWMTVAEVIPLTIGIAVFGLIGALPWNAVVVALSLCGALVGFAPFNRPVARLFLGDVGSLPIGLLLVWLLTQLASAHLTAALLLPLYYIADSTITLIDRARHREPILQAHRRHFYQQAIDSGMSVYQIVTRVFVANVILIALAAMTLYYSSHFMHAVALTAGCAVVGLLLFSFGRSR
jgi:UDP-N-acetylmuramyl pentapeptide phosphotransferase/UDP-N-acetylglucosamine-1-phosphate transferase